MDDDKDALAKLYDQGRSHRSLGRSDDAIGCFERVLQIEPGHVAARRALAGTLNDVGARLRRQGKAREAIGYYERALAVDPQQPGCLYNLGNALGDLGRLEPSIACYRRALKIDPGFADAHHQLANRLRALRRLGEALGAYQRALAIRPDSAAALIDMGIALVTLARAEEAIACYQRALQIEPSSVAAHYNLGNLLVQLGRRDEAIACFARVLELNPDFAAARAKKLHQQAYIGDWQAIAADAGAIARLGIEGESITPFAALALEDAPARHRIRSERYVAKRFPPPEPPVFARPAARPERLRIGYFSADFCNHPTMHLMARIFELHDRSRFAVHAYGYAPNPDDAMRRRLGGAFDLFRDVKALNDRAIASLARQDGIDIAIDLTGHTATNRFGIFSHCCAPVQINYLGYPGTLGAQCIDYIIGDKLLMPPLAGAHYSEKLIRLPHCYQAQDDSLAIDDDRSSRSELGLPANGFVFCAIGSSYKIGEAEFLIWMRLLKRVERSVLWLLRPDALFEANITARARTAGIEPERLVFYDRIALTTHLAHLGHADLFLDTFIYNAGATASHALWAGLPVLTKMGLGYPARMAGSLLSTLGMRELIAASEEEYESMAFALATEPDRLAALREKLATQRNTTPLFDSALFTRHLEAAYDVAWQRWHDGQPTADIEIST